MIHVYETGHVEGPSDMFVTPEVKIEFNKLSESDARGHFASLTSTISLRFVSASTGLHVPIPEGIRVTSGGITLVPWTEYQFLFIIDRPYSIWMSDELLFETHRAEQEIKVPIISRSIASFSTALQRMSTGQSTAFNALTLSSQIT